MNQAEFSLTYGHQAKEDGLSRASKFSPWLNIARREAHRYAISNGGSCDIDVVQRIMSETYHAELGNAAGAVFKGPEWECTGFKPTERVSGHARIVRTWKLRGC